MKAHIASTQTLLLRQLPSFIPLMLWITLSLLRHSWWFFAPGLLVLVAGLLKTAWEYRLSAIQVLSATGELALTQTNLLGRKRSTLHRLDNITYIFHREKAGGWLPRTISVLDIFDGDDRIAALWPNIDGWNRKLISHLLADLKHAGVQADMQVAVA